MQPVTLFDLDELERRWRLTGRVTMYASSADTVHAIGISPGSLIDYCSEYVPDSVEVADRLRDEVGLGDTVAVDVVTSRGVNRIVELVIVKR